MTDVFDQVDEADFDETIHGEELTDAELDELEALGAAEDAELLLGSADA
ncbi:hypothetical protein [Kribbella sp. NPDC023855]